MIIPEPGLGPPPEPEPEPDPQWSWHPVPAWPVGMREITDDLEALDRVISLMHGAAIPGDLSFPAARAFLEQAQRARRSELAALILELHGMDKLMEADDERAP